MRRERDKQAYDVFQLALALPATERGALLDAECGEDHELRLAVEDLLAADAAANSFLQLPSDSPLPLETIGFSQGLTTGTAAAAAFNLNDAVFSHYRIRERLGAGGMGEVYRADDLALGRPSALKFLRSDLPPKFQESLLAEGEVNARLQHPGIATFYETGIADGAAFIAMEYVRGQTLRARLADGPLSEQRATSLATALLEGVLHAHAAGVVHGDIKPENIMLTDDGLPKLLDFGLARAVSEAADAASKAHRVAGTAGYMAPELVRGNPPDARSDLFAIAAVVYEALSGRRAFAGATPLERLSAVLHQIPQPIWDGDDGAKLWPTLAKAMARSPSERHASAAELLRELRACCGRRVPTADSRNPLAVTPTSHAPRLEVDRLCQSGRDLLMRSEKGSLDQAAASFEAALAAEPRCAPALAGLAAAHALRFTYDTKPASLVAATDFARRAIKIDPKLAEAYVWLGYAHFNQDKLLEGYACELKAIELDPRNFLAHYFAPAPLCFSSTRAEASRLMQSFERRTLAENENPHRWRRGRVLAHLREAVRLNPEHGFSWLAMAWCHTELEEFAEAQACFEQTIALESTSPVPTAGAAGYLGECFRRSGDLRDAHAACMAGLEATERTDHMYRDTWRGVCLCSLGRTALDQNDLPAAEAAFKQAILHLRGRSRARAAGHLLVQALAGLSRTSADSDPFGEAMTLNERRDGGDFRWLWGCSEDATFLDLAFAARDLGRAETARALFERAADYGSATASRELTRRAAV